MTMPLDWKSRTINNENQDHAFIKCKNCNNSCSYGIRFCTHCGFKLEYESKAEMNIFSCNCNVTSSFADFSISDEGNYSIKVQYPSDFQVMDIKSISRLMNLPESKFPEAIFFCPRSSTNKNIIQMIMAVGIDNKNDITQFTLKDLIPFFEETAIKSFPSFKITNSEESIVNYMPAVKIIVNNTEGSPQIVWIFIPLDSHKVMIVTLTIIGENSHIYLPVCDQIVKYLEFNPVVDLNNI